MLKTLFFLLSISMASFQQQAPWEGAKLLGKAELTYFVFDVYQAKLWGTDLDNLYQKEIALELIYSREFEGEDITQQTVKELKYIGVDEATIKQWSPQLAKIFVDVKEGDSIMAKYKPSEGLKFFLNREKPLGEIKDPKFSQEFLNIWLSENTSAKAFRKKLLGI
tara:strand:- start:25005 stop:25499 length:495 start_codon:yes stop_codon:yes gene_type:complete